MINFSSLENAIQVKPSSTLTVSNLINAEFQQKLINDLPRLPFFEMQLDETHKQIDKSVSFKFLTSDVINLDNLEQTISSSAWLNFIHTVTSKKYIEKLSKIIKTDLTKAKWAIEFARYRVGDWLDAHYDKQEGKIAVQLFYFNYSWDIAWGGHLNILHPNDRTTPISSIPPTINYSVIIPSQNDSWHEVAKINPPALKQRIAMGLQFFSM